MPFIFRNFNQYFITQPSCFGDTTRHGGITTGIRRSYLAKVILPVMVVVLLVMETIPTSNVTQPCVAMPPRIRVKIWNWLQFLATKLFTEPENTIRSFDVEEIFGNRSFLYHAMAHQTGLITAPVLVMN